MEEAFKQKKDISPEYRDDWQEVQKSMDARLKPLGYRAADARKVIDSLYRHPVTDAAGVSKITGKSNVSAYKLIAGLEKVDILREITGGQRDRVYVFKDYIDLFK